ncbi:MAG: hypothetical protein J5I90_21040 [Caldilineales bacterium]|nr:hypothetical protein [Caldilineales bacterium]
MNQSQTTEQLTAQLNDFDAGVRQQALAKLWGRAEAGEIECPAPAEVANMHCHTFYSYNAYGYSPAGLAWLGKTEGYKLMGTVDFDVLDAVDEWLAAAEMLELRASAGIETRAFVPEFATREINSPGEPGVTYHMGIGFTSGAVPDSAAHIAEDLRTRARARNLDVLARVNAYLAPVQLDYERDVLPLTPKGVATERHMVFAYTQAAARLVPDPAAFWASKLGMERKQVEPMLPSSPALQNAVRSKLMKRGGVGYVQPGPETFPSIEEFHELILACEALPCAAWLDGTSAGEQAMPELLELLIDKGVVALNVIPDRNWNIGDAETKRIKVQKLYEVVELAQSLDLPLNVGTEMNSFGNKLMDDFGAPELAPVKDAFMDGAYFIHGHTVLQRHAGLGYQSAWAQAKLPTRKAKNEFYAQVGRLTPPTASARNRLRSLASDLAPSDLLSQLTHKQE